MYDEFLERTGQSRRHNRRFEPSQAQPQCPATESRDKTKNRWCSGLLSAVHAAELERTETRRLTVCGAQSLVAAATYHGGATETKQENVPSIMAESVATDSDRSESFPKCLLRSCLFQWVYEDRAAKHSVLKKKKVRAHLPLFLPKF